MPTSGPGAYIELGVILGTVLSVWIGVVGVVLGHWVGARTTLAARTMHEAEIVWAEAEHQWAIGELPTMHMPLVPVRRPSPSRRPSPKSRRSNAT